MENQTMNTTPYTETLRCVSLEALHTERRRLELSAMTGQDVQTDLSAINAEIQRRVLN
jgi:hypothetical protein